MMNTEHIQHEDPRMIFLMLVTMVSGAAGRMLGDAKLLIENIELLYTAKEAFHYTVEITQWLCYCTSFIVGLITIYKFFNRKNGH